MQTQKTDTIIIGVGLSGLYAAALLAAEKKDVILLEARPRLGGRILSESYQGFFTDLGPPWYWLSGGMISLLKGLYPRLPENAVRLNHPVCEIQRRDKGIRVLVGQLDRDPRCGFTAPNVILALPPRLAARTILFTPDLSYGLTQAMLKASTWMAGQAKFFALYDRADWRKHGLSGQGFSLSGPLGEIHDGSGGADGPFGLTGFVGIPALRRKDRETMVRAILTQLTLIYGKAAGQPISVHYQDWARQAYTATE